MVVRSKWEMLVRRERERRRKMGCCGEVRLPQKIVKLEQSPRAAQLMSGCGVSVCGRQFAVPVHLIYLSGQSMAAPMGPE